MILRTLTATLSPTGPACGAAPDLRSFFGTGFDDYAALHRQNADGFIHRYPVVQYKLIDKIPTVIGINEGAEALREIFGQNREIRLGESTYRILIQETGLKEEEFGLSDRIHTYEFLTPWVALNQENYRKFYTLKGKAGRDEFMRKILTRNLLSLAKSLNYEVPGPVRCDARVRFRKDQLNKVSVMVFTGKFQANFRIPDLLGIGKFVSRGFGAVRQTGEDPAGDEPSGLNKTKAVL